MQHTIKLTQGAARWLYVYLSQPGVTKTAADAFYVGLLLTGKLEPVAEIKDEEIQKDKAKALEWAAVAFEEFEISESQREAVKRALNACAERGLLNPATKSTLEILQMFGLCPSP
jgi:hypothetical protein